MQEAVICNKVSAWHDKYKKRKAIYHSVFQPKTEPQRHLKTLKLWEMTCSSTFYNYAKFQTSTKYITSVIAIIIPIFL